MIWPSKINAEVASAYEVVDGQAISNSISFERFDEDCNPTKRNHNDNYGCHHAQSISSSQQ